MNNLDKEELEALCEAHWKYTETVIGLTHLISLTKENSTTITDDTILLMKYLYIEAMKHGYKHRDEELKKRRGRLS